MFTDDKGVAYGKKFVNKTCGLFARLFTPRYSARRPSSRLAMGRGPLGWRLWPGWRSPAPCTPGRNFADVLVMTLKLLRDADASGQLGRCCQSQGGKRKKHDPRPADPQALSEEAFVQARGKAPSATG